MGPPDFSTIGRRIRALLSKRNSQADMADDGAMDAPGGPTEVHSAEGFGEQLRALAHEHGQMAVGRLQILGFQAVRERLGDRWPQFQARIPQVIETTFRRRLTVRDVFRRYDDLVYLVIFADLSIDEARVKSHFIAEEIWQQLFGMGETEDTVDVSILTVNVETSGVEAVSDLDTLLAQHFEKAALEVAFPHARPAAPNLPDMPTVSEPEPAAEPAPEATSHTYLSFTPLWTVNHNAVSSYYTRVCLIGSKRDVTYGHDILRRASAPRDTYDFDLATLARVHAVALQLGKNRSPAMLLCPVHYTTLINREARREYLQMCAGLPRAAARHLILEVGGLAEGFPAHTAYEIRHWLKPYCRAAWALVPPLPAAVHNLRDAGFAAVGFDARPLGPVSRIAAAAPLFALAARKHRLIPYMHGLTTPQAATAAADAGFEFLSGDAIQRPFDKVLAPYRLTIDEIAPPGG